MELILTKFSRTLSHPGHAGIFLLKHGFQFGITVCLKRRPVESRLHAFSFGSAQPKLNGQSTFTNMRMFLEGKTFVKFDLQFGRVRLAILIAASFRVE